MGKVVGGFGLSHVLFPPDGVEAEAGRVIDGMISIRERLHALRPDVLVLAGGDHLNNFSLAVQVTLGIGIADCFTTLGDGAPVTTFPGCRDFAEAFARFAARREFELVQVEEVIPDHGMAIPKFILDPENAIPTVPVYINAAMPVPAEPERCHRLGGVLRDLVESSRPDDERVAVVGLGGLSHWLRVPEEGRVAEQFDRAFMAALASGQASEQARMTSEELELAAGNGGLELTAWLFMAGAMGPGARGEAVFYEPIPKWVTGMGGLAMLPEAATH
jgi:hypothetical protein